MPKLLALPNDILSDYLFKYLPAADLCRLKAVCRAFHGKEPESSAICKELETRDKALILSQKYPRESPIMSLFDRRQQVVVSFDQCSAFAWEMTREAQRHEVPGFSCEDCHCKYCGGITGIPRLSDNGLRDGKHFSFFARFCCHDKLLWEGFLHDYIQPEENDDPMGDLLYEPNSIFVRACKAVLGIDACKYLDFQKRYMTGSYVECHFSNITNLTKDDVSSELHVTVISLVQSQQQSGLFLEMRLHYSSPNENYQQSNFSNTDSASFDVLADQRNVPGHRGRNSGFATSCLTWKSSRCLHSFSLICGDDLDDDESDRI